jgi:hypothetical protein
MTDTLKSLPTPKAPPAPKLGPIEKSGTTQTQVPPTPVMSHSDHLLLAHQKTLAIVQYYRLKATNAVDAEEFFVKNQHLIKKRY